LVLTRTETLVALDIKRCSLI